MTNPWRLLAATHLAVGLTGFALAPRELLETEVAGAGFFTVDTKRVLAAAVESLRAENKLLVYSYRGAANVSVERSVFWLLTGQQDMIAPAAVSYYVDLSALSVRYDERTQVVAVTLPALVMGDVAFEPEAARTINGGVLTFSEAQVEELRRINYRTARRAFIAQAQRPSLLEAAKQEARRAVESALAVPLRVAGRPEVRVVAQFGPP
jgi:hypothetical protein